MLSFSTMSALRISLASPEQIRSWSSGEVTEAETINYRTLKPVYGGLFCERIFGPTKNWHCACGKYKRAQFKGKVCEFCGVQVAPARVRRERMGHIELAAPVSHVWYTRVAPSRIALLLDFAPRKLEQIISYSSYIVLEIDEAACQQEIQRIEAEIAQLEAGQLVYAPVTTRQANEELKATSEVVPEDMPSDEALSVVEADWGQLFTQQANQQRVQQLQQVLQDLSGLARLSLLEMARYRVLKLECGRAFRAGIGAEAIHELLGELDLDVLSRDLRARAFPSRKISEETPPIGSPSLRGPANLVGPPPLRGPEPALSSEMGEKAVTGARKEEDRTLRSKLIKRLKIVESLRRSEANPQWMILTAIPVLPPALRPVLQMQGGRFASSDLNELYSRVLHRNNRLKRFLAVGAPELMINREKAMLQSACDALFDNGHCARALLGQSGQPLRSLTDSLSGKGGRFRHNLQIGRAHV